MTRLSMVVSARAAVAALLLMASALRAEVHGGIEMGAKGVKGTVIEITGAGDEQEVKILLSVSHNSTLSAGITATGKFDPPGGPGRRRRCRPVR